MAEIPRENLKWWLQKETVCEDLSVGVHKKRRKTQTTQQKHKKIEKLG